MNKNVYMLASSSSFFLCSIFHIITERQFKGKFQGVFNHMSLSCASKHSKPLSEKFEETWLRKYISRATRAKAVLKHEALTASQSLRLVVVAHQRRICSWGNLTSNHSFSISIRFLFQFAAGILKWKKNCSSWLFLNSLCLLHNNLLSFWNLDPEN